MSWPTPQNARILDHIKRFGWQSQHIHPTESGQAVFTQSIGSFRSYGAPEFVIFGLERGKARGRLSEINTLRYFTAAGAELPLVWSLLLILQVMLGDGPYRLRASWAAAA